MSFWTPERDEELKRLRREGYSYSEIGRAIGVSHTAAHRRVEYLTGARLNQWTPNDDELLKKLRAEGETFDAIARRMGRTRFACIGRWDRLQDGPTRRSQFGSAKAPASWEPSATVTDPRRADRRLRGGAERPWSWQVEERH